MRQETITELKALGINVDNIGICKKIRKLAKLDRLKFDDSSHRSGLADGLFGYIKYCGFNKEVYIRDYLSHLQPYMIEENIDQEFRKKIICVMDRLYRVSIYIKADMTEYDEMIISFHENYRNNRTVENRLIQRRADDRVLIFADSYVSHVEGTNNYQVKEIFQRGMKSLPLILSAIKCDDMWLVSRQAIDNEFIRYCNDYISDLYTSNLELDFDKVELFSVLQQISFTSYGKDTFSSMSLLVDSIRMQATPESRAVADMALVTFTENLKLTKEQRNDLLELLDDKYGHSKEAVTFLLERIKTILLSGNIEEKENKLSLTDALKEKEAQVKTNSAIKKMNGKDIII